MGNIKDELTQEHRISVLMQSVEDLQLVINQIGSDLKINVTDLNERTHGMITSIGELKRDNHANKLKLEELSGKVKLIQAMLERNDIR